jgi:hypothetical protein
MGFQKNLPLTAVIVSYNYSDFLALTLPHNKEVFDNVFVITKPEDTATIELCAKLNVCCMGSNKFTHNGAKFNRGAVYNEFFWKYSGVSDWVVLLDSDILVPEGIRDHVKSGALDTEVLYGSRRYDVDTVEKYKAYVEDPLTVYQCTLLRGFAFGYFQMFNLQSSVFDELWMKSNGNPYPESYSNAESDWQFVEWNFGKQVYDPPFNLNGHNEDPAKINDHGTGKLALLKQYPVIHLGVTGVNNSERLTPKWEIGAK